MTSFEAKVAITQQLMAWLTIPEDRIRTLTGSGNGQDFLLLAWAEAPAGILFKCPVGFSETLLRNQGIMDKLQPIDLIGPTEASFERLVNLTVEHEVRWIAGSCDLTDALKAVFREVLGETQAAFHDGSEAIN